MSVKAHGLTSQNTVVFTSVAAICLVARNTFAVMTDHHLMLTRELPLFVFQVPPVYVTLYIPSQSEICTQHFNDTSVCDFIAVVAISA